MENEFLLSDLLTIPEVTIFVKGGDIDTLLKKELGLTPSEFESQEIKYRVIIFEQNTTRFKRVTSGAIESFLEEIKQMLYYDPTRLEYYLIMLRLKDSFIHLELDDNNEVMTVREVDEDVFTQKLQERVIYSKGDLMKTSEMSEYLQELLGYKTLE